VFAVPDGLEFNSEYAGKAYTPEFLHIIFVRCRQNGDYGLVTRQVLKRN